MQGRAIARHGRIEGQTVALGHDGDAVPGDVAGEDDRVAGADALRREGLRRDDFAVDELIRMFSRRGIIAKVSGITEWIYYCDYTRKHDIQKRLGLLPWYRKPFSKELRELVSWKIEEWHEPAHGKGRTRRMTWNRS